MVERVLQECSLHEAMNDLMIADRIAHSLESCSQVLYDQVFENASATSRRLAIYYVCIRRLLVQWESKPLRIECGKTWVGRPINVELVSSVIP